MHDQSRERGDGGPDIRVRDPRLRAALVPQDKVAEFWPHVAPLVSQALRHGADGMYSLDDAQSRAAEGFWQIWIIVAPGRVVGVALTSINEFPQGRQLFVPLAAGEQGAEAVAVLWPELQAFARAYGCREVRFFGRRGWARSGFLPEGWRHVADVVAVPVGD